MSATTDELFETMQALPVEARTEVLASLFGACEHDEAMMAAFERAVYDVLARQTAVSR